MIKPSARIDGGKPQGFCRNHRRGGRCTGSHGIASNKKLVPARAEGPGKIAEKTPPSPRPAAPPAGKSVVAVNALHLLVPLLRLDGKGRDRARLEPTQTDGLPGLLAIAVCAVLDTFEGLINLRD